MGAFLLTPLREGRRRSRPGSQGRLSDFYSRPCGRGDSAAGSAEGSEKLFLLTPLREGRHVGATATMASGKFLLTPLREGRPGSAGQSALLVHDFYSRPCGRGDVMALENGEKEYISTHAPAGGATQGNPGVIFTPHVFLLTPLREGRHFPRIPKKRKITLISTHAPAGGATWD